MPKMYIISGCNGSGKTTASYTLLPEMLECYQFVNSDEFAKSLSPFDPSEAAISASRYMVLKFKYLIDRGADFGIETTLATRAFVNMVKNAKADGYEITILYFWLRSPELAVQRVSDRVAAGGHNIPEDVIRRRYKRGLEYLFSEYIGLCDKWVITDNSTNPFSRIAQGDKYLTTIYDHRKYSLIWELAHQDARRENFLNL